MTTNSITEDTPITEQIDSLVTEVLGATEHTTGSLLVLGTQMPDWFIMRVNDLMAEAHDTLDLGLTEGATHVVNGMEQQFRAEGPDQGLNPEAIEDAVPTVRIAALGVFIVVLLTSMFASIDED